MSTRMRTMLLALAVAALPDVGRAQVDATIGGTTPVKLPFDAVTPNPTGVKMYYYVPAGATAPMPIVVGLHSCQADQSQAFNWLKSSADTYKFMLVLPFANRVDANTAGATGCWDVGSEDALAPGAENDSDAAAVVALVRYVATTLQCGDEPCGDLARVFATGQSSGGMMTNLLLGTHPDVFEAGASFMGVPYGCWAAGVAAGHPTPGTDTTLGGPAGWSGTCQTGGVTHTPAEWAALLPEYEGTRPRMMIWHGAADTLISPVNFAEAIEQWTQALGVGQAPASIDYPLASASGSSWTKVWTRTRYGSSGGQAAVEAISVSDVGHSVEPAAMAAAELVRFFGLGDSEAPAAPTGLGATDVTRTGATLTWTAPTDDVAVTRYVVTRKEGTTRTPVAWPTATTYALTGLSAETTYTYEVTAVDAAGNISPAASVDVTTAGGSGGGGGGGCGQGVPSGAALVLAAAALVLVRRRAGQA